MKKLQQVSYENVIKKWAFALSLIAAAVTMQSCEKEIYVAPEIDESAIIYTSVFIASNPVGAKIYINGRTTGLVTPDTVKGLTAGEYQVTLKRNYCQDTTFAISAVNNRVTNGYVDYYQSSRMLGVIDCISEPAGARIYIDNEYTGKVTPAVITRIIPNSHLVKYEYPEYRKDSMNVLVYSSSTSRCALTLEDTLDIVTYNVVNSQLPSNDITSAAEDKYGNMWFGTSAEGVLKFDSKKFNRYTSQNTSAISSNLVRRIMKDKTGNMWIGLSNGIARFDGYGWITIPSNLVTSLKANPNNEIIAATYRGGLVKYSNGNIERITSSVNGLSNNDLVSACIDKSGKLWTGKYTGGIDTYDKAEWKHLTAKSGEIPDTCNSALDYDNDGTLFGIFRNSVNSSPTEHTIAKYENGTWTRLFSNVSAFGYNNIYTDSKNRVWFGWGNVIYRISNKTAVANMPQILHSNIRKLSTATLRTKYTSGTDLFVDSKGNLWIVGNPSGLGIIKIKAGRWDN
jgi:hypothetical protein